MLPWAGEFFKLITELGSDLFYIVLLLIGYWAVRKKESIVTILVLMVAVVSNYWLKVAIHNPRPPAGYLYPGFEAQSNWSTPSGHAQNSSMLFGWLAVKVKTWWMLLLSTVLTVLIGLSRVYLGVHYLDDVVLGWWIGVVLVLILWYAEGPLGTILSRYKAEYLWFTLFLVGLAMTVIATYLVPLPPDDNFGALGGLVMGIAVALPLEARFVQFSVEPVKGQKWRLVLRVVLGLAIVLVVMVGLGEFLQSVDPNVDVWLRALRYFLVALIGGFVWPAIFKKIGL